MRLNHWPKDTAVAPRLPWAQRLSPIMPSLPAVVPLAGVTALCSGFTGTETRSRLSLALPTQHGLVLSLLPLTQGLAACHCPQTSSLCT